MESWLTSSFEDRVSFSSPDDMGCTEVSSIFSKEIDDPLYWDGFLRESLKFSKGSQASCSVLCGSRDSYGANAREIGIISV